MSTEKLATNTNYSLSAGHYDSQVATNIAEIRKTKGISQAALADLIGIHVTNLNRIERGKSRPDTARLEQIADALGVSVPELFTGERGSETRLVRVRGHLQAGEWAETWELPDDEQFDVPVTADEQFMSFQLHAGEIRGTSMNRKWPEGTVVIYTDAIETGEDIIPGKRYVVERERADGMREATVKELRQDGAGRLWLWPDSDDPLFQAPIPIDGGEDDTVRIVGRVRYAVTRE